VSLDEISPYLIQATISTEDANFYDNPGFNVRGIIRAAWNNISNQDLSQGGSSITQQLVKNVLIPEEERALPLFSRKIKETLMALSITRDYSKDQILEWYLNQINYGNLSYGIQAAAESYFNKDAKDLTLAEAAMLAGLPQAPGRYSPLTSPKLATNRQHTVLDLMVRQGYITEEQADEAKKEELHYTVKPISITAPHFVMYVRDILEQRYGAKALYRGGLQITTSLDLDLQELAENTIANQRNLLASYNANNASLVSIDPRSGEILAMVGSADYFDPSIDGQVNNATAEHQPGSAFKPFTYLTSFMKGYNPATVLLDTPATFPDGINGPYKPQNVDKTFSGPVSIREALARSMNVPAVKTIQYTGVDSVIDTAHKMGITTLNRKNWYGLSLTLGGGEVKLIDITYAYAVFANNGEMRGAPVPEKEPGMRSLEPVPFLKIEKPDGQVLYEFTGPDKEQVVPAPLSYLITDILSDNNARAPLFGPSSPLLIAGRPAAVKTGSTDDYRDTWTVGYTTQLVTGVWVGNTNNEPMNNVLSVRTAAPIWRNFMVEALRGVPPEQFTRPSGIREAVVCTSSGLLATSHCPRTRKELFAESNIPTKTDESYVLVKIDKATGKLAPEGAPPDSYEEKAFLKISPDLEQWAKDNNIPRPPTEYASSSGIPLVRERGVGISYPGPGQSVSGLLLIRGSASLNDFREYLVEYGSGSSPSSWIPIDAARRTPVIEQTLAVLDTAQLTPGPYGVRLTVYDSNGSATRIVVPITIAGASVDNSTVSQPSAGTDKTPPIINVTRPSSGQQFTIGAGQVNTIELRAEASDNVGVVLVDFFVDGNLIGSASSTPYIVQWKATEGHHQAHATAYDSARNSSKSGAVSITVLARP